MVGEPAVLISDLCGKFKSGIGSHGLVLPVLARGIVACFSGNARGGGGVSPVDVSSTLTY